MTATGDGADFRAEVEAALVESLDAHAARLAPLGPDAARLVDQARLTVTGGKMFRAAFCWWGYLAVAGTGEDDTVPGPAPDRRGALVRACAALELLHASALVHDDLMDASDTRRGNPATHRAFEAQHRAAGWRGDAASYGAAGAILLGDLLLAWSEEQLRRCGLPAEAVASAMEVFDLCRSEVIAGQFLDVSVQARGRADVETAMTVLRYKSAKYSVERPLQVGAALAGGSADVRGQLGAFGLPLGEAFQLRDDLLGVFGDPSVTGKPTGDDLVEGKRTVLIALALDAAVPADAAALDAALGTALTPGRTDELRELIESTGARGQVEEAIGALAATALEALDKADIDDRARAGLRDLAGAVTQRDV